MLHANSKYILAYYTGTQRHQSSGKYCTEYLSRLATHNKKFGGKEYKPGCTSTKKTIQKINIIIESYRKLL